MKTCDLISQKRVQPPRVLALLAYAALCISMGAQDFTDFTHTSDGSAITITGYTGSGGAVSIPGTIDGLPVVAIGNSAFYFKPSVTSVVIPTGVKSIGALAFGYCSGLVSASIPNTVTNIQYSAFNNCRALEAIFIPASVATIGEYAFSYCTSMTSITVAEANAAYSSHEGVLFNKEQTVLLQCPGGKAGGYTLPETTTSIWNFAFRDCSEITDVEIGDNVTTIGGSAFNGCSNLKTVVVGGGVTNILDYAFNACANLTAVYFKGDAPHLGGWFVFLDCENATVYYLEGTSGWEATFGDRPTAVWVLAEPIIITSPAVNEGQLSFLVTGAAGSVVVVEGCADLSHPTWTTVDTVTLTDGSAAVTDPDPANLASRYYRARTQ